MFLKFDKTADNLLEALGISEERFEELINKRKEIFNNCETFFDVVENLNNDDSLSKEEFTFMMIQTGVSHVINSMRDDEEEYKEDENE